MNEVSERSKQLGKLAYWKAFEYAERPDNGVLEIADLIEQALLAERRLAKLEDAEIAERWLLPYLEEPIGDKAHNQCVNSIAQALRAAAEKEVK